MTMFVTYRGSETHHARRALEQRLRPNTTMIVCSCNIITRREIEGVIEKLLADDPLAVLTPNLLYHRLGRRGRCCSCFPHVSRILVDHGTITRERIAAGEVPDLAACGCAGGACACEMREAS